MNAPPVQFVKTSDGYDIAIFIAGDGSTLVRTPLFWNHISRQWSRDWLGPLFDALAERFRLVLYDGRGQGLSTRGLSDTLTLDDYVHDLGAVIDRVSNKPVILSGWSYPAIVAIKYAVEHPERVRALVLWDYIDFHTRGGAMRQLAAEDWNYFVETSARMGFSHYNSDIVAPALLESMSQADHLRQTRVIQAASGAGLISKLTVPTLVLTSRAGARPDGATRVEAARGSAAMLPHARLVLMDDDIHGVLAMETFLHNLPQERETSGQNILSARELDVIRLIAVGKSNGDIADELVISLNTVRRHVSNILDKTGVSNRAQAAVYARDHGLT